MARTEPSPNSQSADPISWGEDPRLLPHPLTSRDAPNPSGCGAEPSTGARRGFLPFSKPKPCRKNFSMANTAWLLLQGQHRELGALPKLLQHFPCLSQPGCAGKVAQKEPCPTCATTATTSPCSGTPEQFWGQGHSPPEGREHLHSLWIFAVIPKGKA